MILSDKPETRMRDINDMAVFVEVARQGGLSPAARHLGLAVSVVSDRLTALERRMGVRLLSRTTRRQTLTEAGQAYLARATILVREIEALETTVRDIGGSLAGNLRVTAPSPLGRQLIAPFLGLFNARYPDVRLHLVLDERFNDILGEGFDIAIRGGPALDTSLSGHRLFDTRRLTVAAPGYLARHGRPERPQDLLGHRCLVFNGEGHPRAEWRFGRGAAATSLRVEGVLASSNSELPLAWALAGHGLTQKSHWEVAAHLASGALELVLEAFEPEPISFYAIHPVSIGQSRKIALFIEQLTPYLRGLVGAREGAPAAPKPA